MKTDFNRVRLIARVAIACTFVVTSAVSQNTRARASDFAPQMGTAAPAGGNAMLRFRVPLGGSPLQTPPTFAFTAGPVWQEQDGSQASSRRLHNSSVIELGIDASGARVRKFAGGDLLDVTPNTLNAEATSDHQALWLVLGGVAILGSALGIYSMLQDECGNKTYC